MKILITGGHITPALAVYEECRKRGIEVVFVGRSYSYMKNAKTMESKMLEQAGARLIHLNAGRFSRVLSFQSVLHLLKIPWGFLEAMTIVKKEKPDKILSFGGYIGLPIAVAGSIFSIPVFTHEQVMVPGITNRILSRFARRVFVTFKQSKAFFPQKKVIVTGNPIRSALFSTKDASLNINTDLPVVYVTGGNLGSHILNRHIESLLPRLLDKFYVVHQTGNTPQFNDYDRLKKKEESNYRVYEHISTDDIGYVFNCADVVVSRSGANSILELIALKKPSVLVPLPHSSFNEQYLHAQLLSNSGAAKIFNQESPSDDLYDLIVDVYKTRVGMVRNLASLQGYIITDSASRIVDCIQKS